MDGRGPQDRAPRRRRRGSWVLGSVFFAAVGACSGGGGGADAWDAAADGEGSDGGEVVLNGSADPPVSPELPRMAPCATGWTAREDEATGIMTCEPWAEGGPADCPEGEARFAGEAGCVPVGPACPGGDWPADLPTGVPIRHVRAGAPAGGDGTIGAPFAAIGSALTGAVPGTVVALARGTYRECIGLPAGVTLWGACVAGTFVSCPRPIELGGAITVTALDTAVRSLTVTGARTGIWVDGPDASCDLTGVRIQDCDGGGLAVTEAAVVTARELVVRDIPAESPSGDFGCGISVWGGATAAVARAIVERTHNQAVIAAESGTVLTLEDAVVRDTVEHPTSGGDGQGLWVDLGASVVLERVVVERNGVEGIWCRGGSVLSLSDVVVRGTRPHARDGDGGFGLVADDCRADAVRATFEGNREAGIVYQGSSGVIEDLVVRDTLEQEASGEWGRGLNVQDSSDVAVVRGAFAFNTDTGVVVGTSTAALTDLTIVGTRSRPSDRGFGHGLQVVEGADAVVERARISGCRNVGFAVLGAVVRVTDLEVAGTLPREADGAQGMGFVAMSGADVDLTRVLLSGNHEHGAVVEDSSARLQHLTVRDTRTRPGSGEYGRGLTVQNGADVVVVHGVFEGNRELAVSAFGTGTVLELEDAAILDTLLRDCAFTTCVGDGAGVGVGTFGGAFVALRGFRIWRSAMCGAMIASGADPDGVSLTDEGVLELRDGEVAWNPIGVNIQAAEYDTGLLVDGVAYYGNERNLDTASLPVPGQVGLEDL